MPHPYTHTPTPKLGPALHSPAQWGACAAVWIPDSTLQFRQLTNFASTLAPSGHPGLQQVLRSRVNLKWTRGGGGTRFRLVHCWTCLN